VQVRGLVGGWEGISAAPCDPMDGAARGGLEATDARLMLKTYGLGVWGYGGLLIGVVVQMVHKPRIAVLTCGLYADSGGVPE
jgi:hypothetical protein